MAKDNSLFLKDSMRIKDRVIIFSGVFDPVHKGHLAIADKALAADGSLIVFLPEREPQHKHGCSDYDDRVNMLRIGLQGRKAMKVLESPFFNHTIVTTLQWLSNQFAAQQKFGLLFGADVVKHMPSWPDIERLSEFGVDRLLIANRMSETADSIDLPKFHGVRTRILSAPEHHLASSPIRHNLKDNHDALPDGVMEYIKSRSLYMSEES